MRPRLAYRPGDTPLHRAHPLVKAAALVAGSVFVFVAPSAWAVVATVAVVQLAFPLLRLPLGDVRGLGLFVVTALLLGALQLWFVDEGTVLWTLGPWTCTHEGVAAAATIAGRFLAVIGLSVLFVWSTDPNRLAYALMQWGLPYRLGFSLVTALRLAATFEGEARTVYRARLVRGARLDVRSPLRWPRLARGFALPLLVGALRRVDGLAISMEGRCFGKYPDRSFLTPVRTGAWDLAALAALAAGLAAAVAWRLGWFG